MKKIAYTLSLIFLMVPLAGCSGTDAEVKVDLSNEEINDLIDENLEDVMNNTTVVVFQDYHNNTTVINQYSNNTTNNVDQSGTSTSTTTYSYNGTSQEETMFVYRKEWSISDIMPEVTPKRDNNFTVEYSYYDYATNDDRTDTFTLPCSNYYDAPEQGSNSTSPPYWNDNDWYWSWWDAMYNNTIRDLLSEVAWYDSVEDSCREQGGYLFEWSSDDLEDAPIIFELDLPNGTALHVIQVKRTHSYTDGDGDRETSTYYNWAVNGVTEGQTNQNDEMCPILRWYYNYDDGTCGEYYGGWGDLHLTFQYAYYAYADSTFTFTIHYELIPVNYVS